MYTASLKKFPVLLKQFPHLYKYPYYLDIYHYSPVAF